MPDQPVGALPASNVRDRRVHSSGLGAWFDHHLFSFMASLGRVFRKPWATLLTIGVITVSNHVYAPPLSLTYRCE